MKISRDENTEAQKAIVKVGRSAELEGGALVNVGAWSTNAKTAYIAMC